MTDRFVRLNVLSNTTRAKADVLELKRDADDLERARNVAIGVDDADGQKKLAYLKLKLDLLGRKVTTAKLDVNDSAGKAKLIDAQLKLERLSKYVASPKITLAGADRTEARLLTIDTLLDRVGGTRTAKIKIDADQSLFSRIGSLFGGAGGASVSGPGALGGGGSSALGALSNPYVATGAITAALATLPFAAQAAAGGIVTALGGGLAAVGIIGAAKTKGVQQDFTNLKNTAGSALATISKPFDSVLSDIAKAAGSTIPNLFGAMGNAIATIAGPFGKFATVLIKTFGSKPVTDAIKAVGKAFGAILTAITPQLPGDIGAMATGITRIANTIKQNPKAFADFIWFLTRIVSVSFDVIAALTSTANYVEKHFVPAFKRAWADIKSDADNLKQWIWNDFVMKIVNFFTKTIPTALDILRSEVRLHWDQIEISTLKFVYNVTGIMGKLPGPLGAPFRTAHKDIGKELTGIESDVRKTANQINSDWDKLHGKKVALTFGLNLPAGVSYPSRPIKGHAKGTPGADAGWAWVGERGPELVRFKGGETVLSNPQSQRVSRGYASGTGFDFTDSLVPPVGKFLGGLNSAFATAMAAIISHVRATAKLVMPSAMGDSGARSHSAAVAQAYARSILGLFGWGPSQFLPLLELWNQESGWNAYAVNPSSGAAGIAQSLGHGPVTLGDYISQINWGLGYIRQRYGSPAAAWGHETAFNWYGKGGWIKEPIIGQGLRSGQGYAFGELGPEYVSPGGQMSGGHVTNYTVNVTAAPLSHPADVGREVVHAIRQYEKRSGKGWRDANP